MIKLLAVLSFIGVMAAPVPIAQIKGIKGRPVPDENTNIYRFVDDEYGIVCYVTGERWGVTAAVPPAISCLKLERSNERCKQSCRTPEKPHP